MNLIDKLVHIHMYGPLDETGYQTCKECGKVHLVPLPFVSANWIILERIEFKRNSGKVHKITYVQQCTITGNLQSHSIYSRW